MRYIVDAYRQDAMLIINPEHGIDVTEQARMRQWVVGGGRLIVASKSGHVHLEAIESYIGQFGMSLHNDSNGYHAHGADGNESLSSGMTVFIKNSGKGRVVLLWGSEWLSRKRLGHAFDRPGRDQYESYNAIVRLLSGVVPLEPAHRRTYRILE